MLLQIFAWSYLIHKVTGLCPVGWTRNINACYFLSPQNPVLGLNAVKTCTDEHTKAHPLVIRSDEDQTFINGFLPHNEYWIGLADLNSDGIFEWVDNSDVTFVNGNLSGIVGQCVVLEYKDAAAGFIWVPKKCDDSFYKTVCELQLKSQEHGVWKVVEIDKRINEKIHTTSQDVGEMQCAVQCLRHLKCMLFNYNKDKGECILHNAWEHAGLVKTADSGWKLYQWESN